MIKNFSKIIYSVLKTIDLPLRKIFKKSFLIWFKDFIENDSYINLKIPGEQKKINLFVPNYLTKWLSDEFFIKEPETIEWIDKFTKTDNNNIIFWDVGANLGLYSIYAALKHSNIEVISFEPSTSNLRVLSRNISINNLQDKIFINQLPLGNKSFNFSLLRESKFGEGESNNSFKEPIDFEGNNIVTKNSYKLLGTSINNLIDQKILKVPNYIKIDVDGLEHLILEGASNYLNNKNIKSIQIEVNENHKNQFNNIIEIMKKNSFKFKYKKRNENLRIYKDKKFLTSYNYYFEK